MEPATGVELGLIVAGVVVFRVDMPTFGMSIMVVGAFCLAYVVVGWLAPRLRP